MFSISQSFVLYVYIHLNDKTNKPFCQQY